MNALREQTPFSGNVELLDNTWLLTLVAVLLATITPRLVSRFDIDGAAIAWGVLGLGLIHVALAGAVEREHEPPGWLPRVLVTLHATGVMLIGMVWQFAGGLQNPVFLLAFVFPVIGATFISPRLPYLTAALAILVVATVGLRQTPELRGYLEGLSSSGASLTALIGAATGSGTPFPGFYAPSAYFVVTLAAFVVLICASAVSAEFLASVLARLHQHAAAARRDLALAEELSLRCIQNLPVPALLIEVDSQRVLCCSNLWVQQFAAGTAPQSTTELLDVVKFSYPEVVGELIAGEDGTSRPCMVRAGKQLRATEIRVQHLVHAGRRLALMIMEDVTDSLCMSAALDAADYAAVIIDARERVLGFNQPARGLWAQIERGQEASPLLAKLGLSKGAWLPGLSGRRKSHVELGGRVYQVRISSIPLPGEADCVYVIAVAPAALASSGILLRGAHAAVTE